MANLFSSVDVVNAILRVRRGPEVDRASNQYEDGELVYSTDKKRLFVGDGMTSDGTVGGNIVGNKIWVTDNLQKGLSGIAKYDLVYRTDVGGNGLYLFVGNNPLDLDKSYILVGGQKILPDKLSIPLPEDYIPVATEVNLGGVRVKDGLKSVNGDLQVNYNNTLKLDDRKQLSIDYDVVKPIIASVGTYSNVGTLKVDKYKGLIVDYTGGLSVAIDSDTIKLSGVNSDLSVLYGDPHKASENEHGVVKFQSDIGGTYKSPFSIVNGVLKLRYDDDTIKVDDYGRLYAFKYIAGGGSGGAGSSFTLKNADGVMTTTQLILDQDYFSISDTDSVLIINPTTNNRLGLMQIGNGLSADVAGIVSVYPDETTIKVGEDKTISTTEIFNVTSQLSGFHKLTSGLYMQYGILTGVDCNQSVTVPLLCSFNVFGPTNIQLTPLHKTLTHPIMPLITDATADDFTFIARTTASNVKCVIYWTALGVEFN